MTDETTISNKPAFIRMVIVAISAGLVMSLTYINPLPDVLDLKPYQPWFAGDAAAELPADRLPFAQWFGGKSAADIPSPSFAGYASLNEDTEPAVSDDTTIDSALAQEAGNTEEDERTDEVLAPPVETKTPLLVAISPFGK